MLIDLHAHTKGISRCCKADIETVISEAKSQGIDGVVLTNHFQKSYFANSSEEDFIKAYINEYYTMKAIAEKTNFSCFFGIEVTMEKYPKVHMLIYGVEPSFLENNTGICDLTQSELFDLVKKNNGILIQAHPYRNGTTVLDPAFLDGVEINCHPLYKKSYCDELISFTEQNSLCVTCGGDFHKDTYRPRCGMYVPENIRTVFDLSEFIKDKNDVMLCVHEPYGEPINISPKTKVQ